MNCYGQPNGDGWMGGGGWVEECMLLLELFQVTQHDAAGVGFFSSLASGDLAFAHSLLLGGLFC